MNCKQQIKIKLNELLRFEGKGIDISVVHEKDGLVRMSFDRKKMIEAIYKIGKIINHE